MSKLTKAALWLAFGAWLLLLTALSSQDGLATARTSGRVTEMVMRLLRIGPARRHEVEALLRLAAHFMCFFGLGALLYAAMRMTRQKIGNIHFWAAGILSAIGILDEVKKVFISGRHLSWTEAGLNITGALCGIIAAMAVIELIWAPKAGIPDEISNVKSKAA